MKEQASRISLHFFGHQADRPVNPLAGALGLGQLPRPLGIEARRFERLAQRASDLFEIAPADSTDIWLYAHSVAEPAEIGRQLARLPAERGRCVFFYGSDDAAPIPAAPRVTIFRTSMFATVRLPHECAMPAFCDDLLAYNEGQFVERPWADRPSVGFCGFVGSPLKRLLYQGLSKRQKAEGLILRERALAAIERSSGVHTNFIRRTQFWGGAMSRFHFNAGRQKDVRTEFVENLFGCDYALCVRGQGNFSFRLYEVLAAGRIPVFVDSDCVLPLEGHIDWRRHVVWVDQRELETAVDRILAFHCELGPDGFSALQRRNRRLWEEWLSPEAFFFRALSSLSEGGE